MTNEEMNEVNLINENAEMNENSEINENAEMNKNAETNEITEANAIAATSGNVETNEVIDETKKISEQYSKVANEKVKKVHDELENVFALVSEKYVEPYYEIIDNEQVYKQAAIDIDLKSTIPSIEDTELKKSIDELNSKIDMIQAKSDEILENYTKIDFDNKTQNDIAVENEALALTDEFEKIIENIYKVLAAENEGYTTKELCKKEKALANKIFLRELNEKIANMIADSKIKNFKIKERKVLHEKVTPIEWIMGKSRLKAAQILNYQLQGEIADIQRQQVPQTSDIGESVWILYDYIKGVPDRYYTKGIANLVEKLSDSEACRELIKRAKRDKAQRNQEEQLKENENEQIENIREEEADAAKTKEKDAEKEEVEEEKKLEKKFDESALTIIDKQEKFFKSYRKATEELQEENLDLEDEIAELKEKFATKKKNKSAQTEFLEAESINMMVEKIQEVIQSLYRENPRTNDTKN